MVRPAREAQAKERKRLGMNMQEIDEHLKSFFDSTTFSSLNELQKLSVASVLHEMHNSMKREIETPKPKNRGNAHSCDIPGCAVCDPCYGL